MLHILGAGVDFDHVGNSGNSTNSAVGGRVVLFFPCFVLASSFEQQLHTIVGGVMPG